MEFPAVLGVFLMEGIKKKRSSGASGGCLHEGASFKVAKAHFAARNKGLENRKNDTVPPSVPPPEALYETVP